MLLLGLSFRQFWGSDSSRSSGDGDGTQGSAQARKEGYDQPWPPRTRWPLTLSNPFAFASQVQPLGLQVWPPFSAFVFVRVNFKLTILLFWLPKCWDAMMPWLGNFLLLLGSRSILQHLLLNLNTSLSSGFCITRQQAWSLSSSVSWKTMYLPSFVTKQHCTQLFQINWNLTSRELEFPEI